MTIPADIPTNRCRCLICGAWHVPANLGAAVNGSTIRTFLKAHEDCRTLGMPALGCTAPGCESTGVGRDTKCAAHGGKLEDRNL